MPVSWLQLESRTYWLAFAAAFLAFAVCESLRPRRRLSAPAGRRWTRHGVLLLISAVISTMLFRATPVAVAVAFASSRFGLLNRVALPYALRWSVAVLALDLARYAAHWSLHSTRLWHVHQVHHSDADFDVSTGARVHPLETILLQGVSISAIMLLAPPVAAVLFVEVASIVQSFFSHANISLPAWVERPLRWVWVTPDMHRIHHSAQVTEQSRNLAIIFAFWDRLFGTYTAEPAGGHQHMMIGLAECQSGRTLDVRWMLMQPFRRLEAQPEIAAVEPAQITETSA